jgi:hypothetical protein
MVSVNAQKDTLLSSGPELVGALRQACQEQVAQLQVLPVNPKESAATGAALTPTPGAPAVKNTPREPSQTAATPTAAPLTGLTAGPSAAVAAPAAMEAPEALPTAETHGCPPTQSAPATTTPSLRIPPPPAANLGANPEPGPGLPG